MKKKGISLIALVITIAVIIILSATVILNLSKNSPISNAKNARDISNEKVREEEIRIKQLNSILLREWDGSVATSLRGSGTKNDPYLISNGSELARFAEIVNNGNYEECAKLTNSINMGNVDFPIIAYSDVVGFQNDGSSITKKYNGTFDGDGNVITGIYIEKPNNTYLGMFGALGENGVIKNLNLFRGNVIGYSTTGGIVGYSEGIIENCTNNLNVRNTNGCAAGISGLVANGRIDNCINYGNMQVNDRVMSGSYNAIVGGIVAYVNAIQNDILIQKCKNYGMIYTWGNQAGGIVGAIWRSTKNIIIRNCENNGIIQIADGSNSRWNIRKCR